MFEVILLGRYVDLRKMNYNGRKGNYGRRK
jgi:hypothetical protein